MRRAPVRLFLICGALVVTAAAVPASSLVGKPAASADSLGDAFDVRAGMRSIPPTTAQTDAIVALAREYPDVRFDWNARFGTPASILRHGKTLSGPVSGAPEASARRWLERHAALFGWKPDAVAALRTVKTLTQPGGGPRAVLFHQRFGALEGGSFGGSVVAALDRENRLLSVRANVVRLPAVAGAARLGAAGALAVVSGVEAPDVTGTRGEWTVFERGRFAAPHYARPVAFPSGTRPAHPAWEILFVKALDDVYRTVVDAGSGEVLYRYQIARAEAPEGRVFRNYPTAPRGGGHEMRSFKGDPEASPAGWLSPASSDAPFPTTIGNNASTATNWGVFIAPDGPGGLRPPGPNSAFDYPFTNAWEASKCGENPISSETGSGDTPAYAEDALPAVVNLFYHHNVMHDFFHKLGFDEEAGALQANNFGKTTPELQNDPILGLVQAGALAGDVRRAPTGRDNAYMLTLPDGLPSWSGMFLFESLPGVITAPCRDGDFDSAVIYHEYTHAVSSRWVGGEWGNLDPLQGGAMGESWSDFYAVHFLMESGLETDTGAGKYVTGSPRTGIRNWPLAEVPVGFGDIGYDLSGPEVHADGEIWNGVLWDVRTALDGARAGGARLAAQLIADAMPISGPSPSMLDMRDAILAADLARTKGANQSLLWTVFARHGMGLTAVSKDADETDPLPSFAHKDKARNGRLEGRVVDASTGRAIPGAKLTVGQFELRVASFGRTATDGSFTIPFVAGTHRLTIQARGYGSHTFGVTIDAGRSTGRTFEMRPNYASTFAGAKIAASSNPSTRGLPGLALDDNEGSTWRTSQDADGPAGEWFVVDLAGDAPVAIDRIRVSGMPLQGTGRFVGLKDWKVLASMDGKKFTEVARGEHASDPLWPTVANLHYRSRTFGTPVHARFLKFVASPHYAPANSVQVADLQVFGRGDPVSVHGLAHSSAPFRQEGTVILATENGVLTTRIMEEASCTPTPPTQGLDAWVVELPVEFGDGTHTFSVHPEPVLADPLPDLDVYFETSACERTGEFTTPEARESGIVPQASKYAVVQLASTTPAKIIFQASPERIAAPKATRVKGAQKRRTLPATGVGTSLPLALTSLGGAVAVTSWIRRQRRA